MPTSLVTFADIRNAAIARVKADPSDDETVSFFDEVINTRYKTICSRKKWKFLRVTERSIKLPAKYTTGTVSITSGSRTVSGVGTNWTSDYRKWWFKVDGSTEAYRIISITSTTEFRLASAYLGSTISGSAYKIYPSELALFPDLEDIDDMKVEGKPWKVEPVGPSEIMQLRRRYPNREGAPQYYTIEGTANFSGAKLGELILAYDFMGSGDTKAASFWPSIPDDDYTLHPPYKKSVSSLVLDDDEPLIPIEHRHILLYFCLSDWYMKDRQDQTGKYYEGLAQDELRELQSKYLDTDDVLMFRGPDMKRRSHSYLMRHSQNYFDTE